MMMPWVDLGFAALGPASQLGRALQKQKNRQKRENEVAWLWRKKMTPVLALAPKFSVNLLEKPK